MWTSAKGSPLSLQLRTLIRCSVANICQITYNKETKISVIPEMVETSRALCIIDIVMLLNSHSFHLYTYSIARIGVTLKVSWLKTTWHQNLKIVESANNQATSYKCGLRIRYLIPVYVSQSDISMYVCIFKILGRVNISGLWRPNEGWVMMIMMAKWYSETLGPKASWHLSYRWGKTPKNLT